MTTTLLRISECVYQMVKDPILLGNTQVNKVALGPTQ